MFSGITGLQANGEMMSILGNNIANINTIAFKGSKMFFEDIISQDVPTSAGVGQVGRGVRIGAIYSDFSQGSFDNTNEATDLAIGGDGFFIVKAKTEEASYFTRAGNFRFDKDGYLVDPHGYVLQGWQIDTSTQSQLAVTENTVNQNGGVRIVGTPTDIKIGNFQSPPQATGRVTVVTNLDSQEVSRSNPSLTPSGQLDQPFFAMIQNWRGNDAEQPIGESQYGYQSTIKVYDDNGTSHELTVYYDQVTMSNSGGRKVWEYMVTIPPSEDMRYIDLDGDGVITDNERVRNSSAAGLLMFGTMTFNAGGQVENMSSFTLTSNALVNGPHPGEFKNLSNWSIAEFSENGYPVFIGNFLGVSNASFPDQDNVNNNNVKIELNLGLRNQTTTFVTYGSHTTAGSFYELPPNGTTLDLMPRFEQPERAALATTSYSTSSTTIFQAQDGYAPGFLQNVSVDRDGVLTGRYSNGQVLELYLVTLADFNNEWGLRRDGGNLFTETRESGPALTNRPNTAGLGSIVSNSLEQSNVDMATEFVNMITTQRGFQASSKVITTTDSMLNELIQLKR
jgi:flagellar hook protein FlgE